MGSISAEESRKRRHKGQSKNSVVKNSGTKVRTTEQQNRQGGGGWSRYMRFVSLGLLCDNRSQDVGGTNLYFREEMREKKGEGLRIIMMGLKRLVMGSICRKAGITEPGRATVSST
jgi:hypothetical protein